MIFSENRFPLFGIMLYDQAGTRGQLVLKRFTILAGILALGLSLGGCSKCGWIWDDWKSPAKSCRDDVPK